MTETKMRNAIDFMQLALQQAKLAFEADEVPVGAVITKGNDVIALARNEMISQNDPTAHAEILAIRKACQKLNSNRLPECTLYVTLEPCPMCLSAISLARIPRIYFGASDLKSGGISAGNGLVGAPALHSKPDYYEGFLEKQCAELLQLFFKNRR